MKKLLFIAIFATIAAISAPTAQAQHVSISFNVDSQPAWGPTGYDYAQYYYMPDLNVYYDISSAVYYYLSGGSWISSRYLPRRYSNYDLYNVYKVVVNERNPWYRNNYHKKHYAQYRNNHSQTPIRDSHDKKYQVSRRNERNWRNPEHNNNHNSHNVQNNKHNNNSHNRR